MLEAFLGHVHSQLFVSRGTRKHAHEDLQQLEEMPNKVSHFRLRCYGHQAHEPVGQMVPRSKLKA